MTTRPTFKLHEEDGRTVLTVAGDWTVTTIQVVDEELRALELPAGAVVLDVSELGRIDTSGALVIDRTLGRGDRPEILGSHHSANDIIAQVHQATQPLEDEPAHPGSVFSLFERTGRGSVKVWQETVATLSFLGEALYRTGALVMRPARLRWTPTVAVMEEAGLDALPIVAFLSFFVGMVVAFIGATTLADFGATIFVVELVGISMMREFGVILTAIILAGRTNSSFTAQIGAMRMRQEIDAMTTLGLSPMEVLVVPRILAMVLMTPVLSMVATLAGIAGGVVVGWLALDINPTVFAARLQDYVPVSNFWVGLSKAPVFGLVVALIGCRQGLLVGGSVQSLGHHTTTSVVQAIFSIIVIDALFAIFYMELGI
ncbi:MAG: MlaE family lipid ABC transporter permease subunit [Alphaproteobacteria bacterium]|jgi:phospholipid/cholesterol/gamma-HCH transport system permease protein|nr:MlaE family lipid ABC transporter permease subunit [Alphaproteobacteria bacterium]